MNKFKLPEAIRKHQILVVCVVGIVLVGVFGVVMFMATEEEVVRVAKPNKIIISNIAKGAKAEDNWVAKGESQLQGIDERVRAEEKITEGIENKIAELFRQNERLIEELNAAKEENNNNKVLIDNLVSQVSANYEKKSEGILITEGSTEVIRPLIQNKEIDLIGGKDSGNTYNLQDYLPPGSYARAVVTSGADVSVGISSQSNPIPTQLRVVGKARTAAVDGKAQEVDISGCTLTAAATGDLSSERGYMRLLKMTCGVEEGVVRVTSVEGYVAGMGQAGIRGKMISREGEFVKQSFLAGIVGGIGKGASQKLAGPLTFGGGFATTKDNNLKDILGSGIGKGVEDSSNNLSNYLIKRAEQYQPVISLPAGIEVEVVFSEGVFLDGRSSKGESK